ncbi:MAG: CBS domain-containing protein [Clostridiales bacterium]|nr:CBS domain-containing protein [Clostridiales bacterium]
MLLIPKSQVDFIQDDDTVRQGLEKFRHHGYTAVPLINKRGKYLGTISDKDFLRYIIDNKTVDLRAMEDVPIKSILRPTFNPPVSIDADMLSLFEQVMDQNFVPVVDSRGLFVGIITRRSVLSYVYENFKEEIK